MAASRKWKVPIFLITSQLVFTVIFAFFGSYGEDALPEYLRNSTDKNHENSIDEMYPEFQDVHVMIFIGFGFLMTFLKRYGFSSVGFNFLVAAFVIQWATVVRGVLHMIVAGHSHFTLQIEDLLTGDFAAATVLISMGAVLGKTSPLQLLVMATIEVILSQVNEFIGFAVIQAVDVGESMFIHAFGAYFGLAVAAMLYTKDTKENKKEGSVYHSDLFAMIGTVFLWIYWPSFNGGGVFADQRHRAVINTYFSLAACCVISFAISSLVDKKGKLDMVHVQNATLAGGVAVGTTANLLIQPYGALLLGSVAGAISVIGYKYLTPLLHEKFHIHDTCGVNNLHGMPGILAAIAGAVVATLSSEDLYGPSLYDYFPARVSVNGTAGYAPGVGRSAAGQGGYQIVALLMTLGISIIGGLLTGLLLKCPIWDNPAGNNVFDDGDFWETPDDGVPIIMVDSDNSYVHLEQTKNRIYIPGSNSDKATSPTTERLLTYDHKQQ